MLLILGEDRIDEPDEATRSAVEAILDVERLERRTKRVFYANVLDWERLLKTA